MLGRGHRALRSRVAQADAAKREAHLIATVSAALREKKEIGVVFTDRMGSTHMQIVAGDEPLPGLEKTFPRRIPDAERKTIRELVMHAAREVASLDLGQPGVASVLSLMLKN